VVGVLIGDSLLTIKVELITPGFINSSSQVARALTVKDNSPGAFLFGTVTVA
jgi:hypothetical protein